MLCTTTPPLLFQVLPALAQAVLVSVAALLAPRLADPAAVRELDACMAALLNTCACALDRSSPVNTLPAIASLPAETGVSSHKSPDPPRERGVGSSPAASGLIDAGALGALGVRALLSLLLQGSRHAAATFALVRNMAAKEVWCGWLDSISICLHRFALGATAQTGRRRRARSR
jgi:hypothetical protein